MDPDKRKALEATGWKVGNEADFLGEREPCEWIFPRTGQPALQCTGTLLARATSKREKGNLSRYWHELTLVRAASNKLVLAVSYRSDWPQETPQDDAFVLDDLIAVPPALAAYEPLDGVAGYPEGEQFEARQRKLEGEIWTGYYAAVARLLAEAGIVERV